MFQALCPNSVSFGIPQARRIHETFEPGDVCVVGLHATFEHHEAYSSAMLKSFIQEYRLNSRSPSTARVRRAQFR